MKIKRFQARSMREAIRLVREEQGPDAVILSNRRTADGVEVVAAVDYDAALIQQNNTRPVAAEADAKPAQDGVKQPTPASATPAEMLARAIEEAPVMTRRPRPQPPMELPPEPPAHAAAPRILRSPFQAPEAIERTMKRAAAAAAGDDNELQTLQREMNTMRRLLEEQLAGLMWGDMQQRRPRQAAALRALVDLGVEPDIARQIAEELPDSADAERARFLPLGLLARRLMADGSDPVMDGGVIAMVGPTGVGKTTTIAKLAARWSARHGTRDIALVTMDHYRVGATEQLYMYGRLLGVPVYAVSPAESLQATLERLKDRSLVLIDTAGMSQRDRALDAALDKLHSASKQLKTFLVLAANTQPAALEETVSRFGEVPPAACVLTKLDEASRVGGALSITIRRKLPIAYYADGQRVPEDLHAARADRLVLRATQLARQAPVPIDEGLFATGFTDLVTAHA